jgi:hypothetical protein
MRAKYAKDGVVAVSVCVDDPTDKAAIERAEKFLTKQKAGDVINFRLDEPRDAWLPHFKTDPPLVFVFDKENRIALKLPDGDKDLSYEDVEKKVQELLKK